MSVSRLGVAVAAFVLVASAVSARQSPRWAEGFEARPIWRVASMLAHDEGAGPELHAFGQDPIGASARFDGTAWKSGPPSIQNVRETALYGAGANRAIVATTWTGRVLRVVGGVQTTIGQVAWTSPPAGDSGPTRPIATFDDGGGEQVYVGGWFHSIDGVPVANIARWDGTTWSAVGAGVNGKVEALAVHDDGSGPALYAVGHFTTAGGSAATKAARWRNGAWSALPAIIGTPEELAVFDDGSGPRLYCGGEFPFPSDATLLRWAGASWQDADPQSDGHATSALAVHDDGGGPALFAATRWNFYPSTAGLRRFRNGTWATLPMPTQMTIVRSMCAYGGRLWVGGEPGANLPEGSSSILAWDGTQFRDAFAGLGTNEVVNAALVHDFGAGPRLVATGAFQRAGRTPAGRIAAFDGTSWSYLGPGILGGPGSALAVHDDGTGSKLYVGGNFHWPGRRMAAYDGVFWSVLGAGVGSTVPASTDNVNALRSFDDGTGVQLWAGGRFATAGGTGAANVARWNGSTWSAAGAGFNGDVLCFAVFDAGNGPRLYAGGSFTATGATAAQCLARWENGTWVAAGPFPPGSQSVNALYVHDDGTGPQLYAAGRFDAPSGNVVRFDGVAWTAVGAGLPGRVASLAAHDDGTGLALYAGMRGTIADAASRIRRWNGSAWSPIDDAPGARTTEAILALASYDDPSNDPPALFALGQFEDYATLASNVAKWSASTEDVLVCLGDGSATTCPCGNSSPVAVGGGCLNSAGLAGVLRTSGLASTTNDTLVLLGSAMTNGTVLYFQGTTIAAFGAGSVFGDGLRCAAGTVIRLGAESNSGGASQVPSAAHPTPLGVAGAIPALPATRVYQAWYRNAASFCSPSTWNLTNGVRIAWRP